MVKEKVGVLGWLRKQLEAADKDLLREMVKTMAQMLMNAGPGVGSCSLIQMTRPDPGIVVVRGG
jgi:hypothetical protein